MVHTPISHHLVVPADYIGWRLDQALAALLPQYSRSRLQLWLTNGWITVDGVLQKAKTKLEGDEIIEIDATLEQEQVWQAEDLPLTIIFEDEHLLIVNKPADLVTHPATGNSTGTLVNALLHYLPALEALPRAGLIHRLDKDTTGLLVVAKTLETHTRLVKQMQAREIHREYIAIVNGHLSGSGTVEAPIGRHPRHRQKMAINPLGKPAVTHYRALEYFRGHTLAKLILETGRTHQIRVHLTHIRHPIAGDQTYGQLRLPPGCSEELSALLRSFTRQALHAKKLMLVHPITQKHWAWQAPIPEDMLQLITALRDQTTDEDYFEDEELDADFEDYDD